jgi:hypothetical protein
MDLSKISPHIMQVLQDKQLSMSQKMMAFNMLMPNLPPEPKHAAAYEDNLKVGDTIKRLVDEGKIRLGKFNKNFILEVETVA